MIYYPEDFKGIYHSSHTSQQLIAVGWMLMEQKTKQLLILINIYKQSKNNSPYFFVQSPSHVQFFANPWTAAHQVSLPPTQSLPKFTSMESVCHPTISSSVALFSFFFQSFPASGSFPLSQLFASGCQVLELQLQLCPSNEYSGFPCLSVAQLVKNPPAMQETPVQFLHLEKGTATHSSILAWIFHGLHSRWGHKKSDMTE